MTLLPGYPILMGSFFICFGIFHCFQSGREQGDTLYSVLLPVAKRDVVRSKYRFTAAIQALGFLLTAGLTILRMTALSGAVVYQQNALMNATPCFLAFELLVFTAFNVCFLGGFFRDGYRIGIPFITFGVATLVIILVGETLHHLPHLSFLHAPEGQRLGLQCGIFAAAAIVYAAATILSCRASMRRFEQLDL